MTAEQLIDILKLKPLEIEGGYYFETYRSEKNIASKHLPNRYKSDKSISTAIFYLLTTNTISKMHRLISDEIFHFYLGDPVQMLQLNPNGNSEVIYIGNDILAGQLPQVVAKRGVWQGCKLIKGGNYALMGTTVAPGFEFEDFEDGNKEELVQQFSQHKRLIEELTF